ncbi:MAG: 50S ribosomal protein L18e [Candidatus Heimdallarchaeota archaeon]|nr:50S ribosomal protein L18e [Candidatus Heimdallarchaeota archaeon]
MPRRTGPTDPNILELIHKLKKKSAETNKALWKTVANRIEKPRRQRVAVNLSKINRFSKTNDIVIVPGSVLSSGDLKHKVTIAALRFSEGAKEKISSTNSKTITLDELMESGLEVSKMKIII